MFSLGKLKSLPYKTRIRKLILILDKGERDIVNKENVDTSYLLSLINGCIDDFPDTLRMYVQNNGIYPPGDVRFHRFLNIIRHSLLSLLGSSPSEWDFIEPGKDELDRNKRIIFPVKVFLEDIRSPFNVGSMFRTAESFGVSHVYLSEHTPSPEHKRARKTARGCGEVLPWSYTFLDDIARETGIFGLEVGQTPIHQFQFPLQGIVLIGSEELGLSPEALDLAKQSAGIVSIPMAGAKRSLNVSVAFGILMYWWFSSLYQQ